MITDSLTYKAYFQKYKGLFGIKTVGFGDYDRFLLMLKDASTKYPVLWVERPEPSKIEFGGSKKRFTGGLMLLKNMSNATTFDQEDIIINECEEMMWQILEEMERDADTGLFEFDDAPTDLQAKDRSSGDMAIGCRAEIKIIGGYDC